MTSPAQGPSPDKLRSGSQQSPPGPGAWAAPRLPGLTAPARGGGGETADLKASPGPSCFKVPQFRAREGLAHLDTRPLDALPARREQAAAPRLPPVTPRPAAHTLTHIHSQTLTSTQIRSLSSSPSAPLSALIHAQGPLFPAQRPRPPNIPMQPFAVPTHLCGAQPPGSQMGPGWSSGRPGAVASEWPQASKPASGKTVREGQAFLGAGRLQRAQGIALRHLPTEASLDSRPGRQGPWPRDTGSVVCLVDLDPDGLEMQESTLGVPAGQQEALQRARDRASGQCRQPWTHSPSPAVSHQPPAPAHRRGSDHQPAPGRREAPDNQAGPLSWHILITHILTVIDGGDLARGLAGLQATSSYRKDQDGKSDPWQGPAHCPTAVGKCSRCKHFLKTGLQGNVHAGLIKHCPPGWTGQK